MLGSPSVDAQDYIVEQGTVPNSYCVWVYRKWNSGIAECHTKVTTTLVNSGTTWVSPYYTYGLNRPNYPFTFIEAPVEIVMPVRSSANSYWLYKQSGASSNNSTVQTSLYIAIKQNSFTNGSTLTVTYSVKGRWK